MEPMFVAVWVDVDEPPLATAAAVPAVDHHPEPPGAEPLGNQVGFDVGAEHLGWRGVELPHDPHHRELVVDGDLGVSGHGGHRYSFSLSSGIDRRTSSSRS